MRVIPNDGAEFFCEKSHQHDFYHVAGNERNQNREHGFLQCRVRHEHKSENAACEENYALKNHYQRNHNPLFFLGMNFFLRQKDFKRKPCQKRHEQICPQKSHCRPVKQNLNSGLARVNRQSDYAKKQKNRHGNASVNRAQKQSGRHCQHILERNRDSARKRNQNKAASRNQRRKKRRQN